MRSAATSPSTRCSTTSARFRSSITSAGSTISTRGSSAASAIPTCASSKIPCACCAPSSSRRACSSRSIEPVLDAIAAHRHEIARSAPARLVEEYYKILRSGHAEEAFRQLRATGLLKEPSRPSCRARRIRSGTSIAALDRYRAKFEAAPDSLTNAILAGTLLHPLGLVGAAPRFPPMRWNAASSWACCRSPRRDIERLQQILVLQPRLLDIQAPARAQRGLLHRAVLTEALTWLEIHGDRPDVVAHWRALQAEPREHPHGAAGEPAPAHAAYRAAAAGAAVAAAPARDERLLTRW